jgi:ATP-dependent RNA helicase DDX23/PRP28
LHCRISFKTAKRIRKNRLTQKHKNKQPSTSISTMSSLSNTNGEDLIPAEFLATLTEAQREEALAAAAAAKRAEERAEQRALERALRAKEEARRVEKQAEQVVPAQEQEQQGIRGASKIAFVSKKEREKAKAGESGNSSKAVKVAVARKEAPLAPVAAPVQSAWSDAQRTAIQQSYLGKRAVEKEEDTLKQRKKERAKKKITFKFQWDNTEDTFNDDDVLYSGMIAKSKPNPKAKKRRVALEDMPSNEISLDTVKTKPLHLMTKRDWRIFRENYDIVVKGGKTPPPLRRFEEPPTDDVPTIHTSLLQSIQRTLRFKEPSPIQRQAIPIGMQRRDLIGIAETGSGKTVAFGVPLCHFILCLPPIFLNRVAEQGPLAIVIAPTRELALQIDAEFQKLLSYAPHIISVAIVGGQPIQQQAQKLRKGVHIVVGTPGRMNDCLETTYMVLNQCCYVVLDEFDRTLDMGFLPQTTSILDAMGGLLKSENEKETYEQERQDLEMGVLPKHRVTAMFSATMTPEVEKVAQAYLRHPATISIGDQDSRKNTRIVQRIVFLPSPSKKESALRDILARRPSARDKIIVFVNERKHADGVGRMVERMGRRCVVLHGGKSQDQREEHLAHFRQGGVVLVATDVAGRGLDIADVSHVINFDLPTRSIDNYSHRIGRTGRAGKEGLATSFITDEDEGIMADLKKYLESTGNPVPDKLARHPAAAAGHGGNIT